MCMCGYVCMCVCVHKITINYNHRRYFMKLNCIYNNLWIYYRF